MTLNVCEHFRVHDEDDENVQNILTKSLPRLPSNDVHSPSRGRNSRHRSLGHYHGNQAALCLTMDSAKGYQHRIPRVRSSPWQQADEPGGEEQNWHQAHQAVDETEPEEVWVRRDDVTRGRGRGQAVLIDMEQLRRPNWASTDIETSTRMSSWDHGYETGL